MASFICVAHAADMRVLAVQMDGATTRGTVEDVLSHLSQPPPPSSSVLSFRVSVQACEHDELFVACATRAGLCFDDGPVMQRAVALVRSLGGTAALVSRRWAELFAGLERLLDGGEATAASRDRVAAAAAQWDNFLSSSRSEAERLAAAFSSGASVPVTTPAAPLVSATPPPPRPPSPRPGAVAAPSSPLPSRPTATGAVAASSSPLPPHPASPQPQRPAPPGSPRAAPPGSPLSSPVSSPRPGRPKQPSTLPLALPLPPQDAVTPAIPETAWIGELAPVEGRHVALLSERAFHSSAGKELSCFFMVGSLHFAPARDAVYPLVFEVDVANASVADQFKCNPSLDVAPLSERSGAFRVSLPVEPPNGCAELIRFLVCKQFPASRVPLRLVPTMPAPRTMELVYEMNPVVESMEKLVVEVLCGGGAGGELAVEHCRNKEGTKIECSVDKRNSVCRVCIPVVLREKRRDRLTFTFADAQTVCVSVSVGFASKKQLFCQMTPEFKGIEVAVSSSLGSRSYFATQ